jgi:DHA1 family bicyclomycin/chloramphenicol resistance-like MFS transporter
LFIYTGHITVFWFFALLIPLGFGNGMTLPNAMTGSMSVRPKLTGTAAGLGGSMMIAGGAALSAIAGSFMSVEHGALPLLLIMMAVSFLSIVAIVWVILRDRALTL